VHNTLVVNLHRPALLGRASRIKFKFGEGSGGRPPRSILRFIILRQSKYASCA